MPPELLNGSISHNGSLPPAAHVAPPSFAADDLIVSSAISLPPAVVAPLQAEATPPVQGELALAERLALDDVRERVFADDTGKWDVTLPRQSLLMDRGKLVLPADYEGDYPPTLSLSPWATAQACTRLGIPTAYFRRCPPPLRDAQFNHWTWIGAGTQEEDEFDDEPEAPTSKDTMQEKWLLRAKHSAVRGVLSSRYARLDNHVLLDCLAPLLESRLEVRGLALTDESLHLRLVDPRLSRDVLPNDRLMVGLHIANSEVGRRAVSVDALVYRLVCKNGLIRLVKGKSLLRQRHISWQQERFTEALTRALGEALTAGAGLIEQLSWATRAPVTDVQGTLLALVQQGVLTQSTHNSVVRILTATEAGQQETVYGLVNALTLTAQGLSPDDRYDLEVMAGRLLEHGLPRPFKAGRLALVPGGHP